MPSCGGYKGPQGSSQQSPEMGRRQLPSPPKKSPSRWENRPRASHGRLGRARIRLPVPGRGREERSLEFVSEGRPRRCWWAVLFPFPTAPRGTGTAPPSCERRGGDGSERSPSCSQRHSEWPSDRVWIPPPQRAGSQATPAGVWHTPPCLFQKGGCWEVPHELRRGAVHPGRTPRVACASRLLPTPQQSQRVFKVSVGLEVCMG